MTAGVAGVPIEALATLCRRLAALPGRHPRREALSSTAELYAISRATLYRLLRDERRPRDAHYADRGTPRVMPDWKSTRMWGGGHPAARQLRRHVKFAAPNCPPQQVTLRN